MQAAATAGNSNSAPTCKWPGLPVLACFLVAVESVESVLATMLKLIRLVTLAALASC